MTAYEVRISDWSSDVCSSDLPSKPSSRRLTTLRWRSFMGWPATDSQNRALRMTLARMTSAPSKARSRQPMNHNRSEEHTSELQSLMRNSYAVFCLKKKKKNHLRNTNKKKTKS